MQHERHDIYMNRCLQLAVLGSGYVAPNPMVGAVLVHEGRIIGEGYHQVFGGAHAEVNCINNAKQQFGDKISEATLYVSLEPCAHFGKTPPCADLIINNRIPKVVIGCSDIFDEVNGKGIEKLLSAGISVINGVLRSEAIELNKAFFTFHSKKRPYVILKWAETADGFIASDYDERLLISNEYSNRLVHQWRSACSTILVGANTAIKDDPLLDNRLWFGKKPQKVIIDPQLKTSTGLKLFRQGDGVIVFNTIKEGKEGNIDYLKISKDNMVQEVLHRMYQLQIQSVLIEGGQKILELFIESGLWDEARVIRNTDLFIGRGMVTPILANSQQLKSIHLYNDEITFLKNKNNSFVHAVA